MAFSTPKDSRKQTEDKQLQSMLTRLKTSDEKNSHSAFNYGGGASRFEPFSLGSTKEGSCK